MGEAAQIVETMDVGAFLTFLDARRPGERWELHDGVPRLMVGGTARHGILTANIIRAIFDAARSRGCRALTSTLWQANEFSAFEPDVVVACGRQDDLDRHIKNPVLVFEVLSPSTMRYDRGLQFDGYRRMESIQQIVFVYQDSIRVEAYFRNGDSWAESPKVLVSRTDSLAIPILGTSLPLEAVYLDVGALALRVACPFRNRSILPPPTRPRHCERSNPSEAPHGRLLGCFVANAPRNDDDPA